MNLSNCYKLLNLSPDATREQAKLAYKAMVRRWHPDQFFSDPLLKNQAEEALKQINIAYGEIKPHLKPNETPGPATGSEKQAAGKEEPDHKKQRASSGPSGAKAKRQNPKRPWLDNLIKTLNRLSSQKSAAGAPFGENQAAGTGKSRRAKTFGQVLDEMADGDTGTPGDKPGFRRAHVLRSSPYKRTRRRGTSIGGIGPVESPGRVRPVTRVRGIGKSR